MAKALLQVAKQGENSASLMRRFSRKAADSGLVKKVRSLRYAERKTISIRTKEKRFEKNWKNKQNENICKKWVK
ncbi:MAG: hypothetical protein R3B39_01930 [Candidatus Paceibacterota bacterium]